jgi:dihydroorotate dehydrogenase
MRIIGAPFGNYLQREGWISTIGTFTPKYRGGLPYRLWRCARTLRYSRENRGWINKLGLPNPGRQWLMTHPKEMTGKIVSLGVAHDDTVEDWVRLLIDVGGRDTQPLAYEINASCPNEKAGLGMSTLLFEAFSCLPNSVPVFVKIPPVNFEPVVETALAYNLIRFHACNTLPTPRGGLSGPMLRPCVLSAIAYIRKRCAHAAIIAGGGVRCGADASAYYGAGADHVATASAWFNPWNWRHLESVPDSAISWRNLCNIPV